MSQGGSKLIRDSALRLASGCYVQQGMDTKLLFNNCFHKNDSFLLLIFVSLCLAVSKMSARENSNQATFPLMMVLLKMS